MTPVQVEGGEILLANPDGKIYALCDGYNHINAPLSLGARNGNVITCAFYGAKFDVTTGKKVYQNRRPGRRYKEVMHYCKNEWKKGITMPYNFIE
jgi:nitrite reductase/ring-hydroxylating ferredoxin subunit